MAKMYITPLSRGHMRSIKHPYVKASFCLLESGIINNRLSRDSFGKTYYEPEEIIKIYKCLMSMSKALKN